MQVEKLSLEAGCGIILETVIYKPVCFELLS